MKIKWTLEFDFPVEEGPVVRDPSRWLNNKLVEVTGLTFTNGVLAYVVCLAHENTRSFSPVVYRTADTVDDHGAVIPDRKELDKLLPKVLARARAEALVSAARQAGLPEPFTAVRAMLQCQEEFVSGVNDIYDALNAVEAAHGAGTQKK